MAPLAGIPAHFYQLLLCFQEVTQLLILVYPHCYSCLLGQHSQFSILHFAQTLSHQNKFVWLYTSVNHSWWCLLLARSQSLQLSSSFYCLSISSFLKVIARILFSSYTRIHSFLLNLLPSSTAVYINQVLKNLLWQNYLWFHGWKIRYGERGKLLVGSLMLSVAKGWKIKFPLSLLLASDSSSCDLPCVCIREKEIWRAERVWCSQTPHMWLA